MIKKIKRITTVKLIILFALVCPVGAILQEPQEEQQKKYKINWDKIFARENYTWDITSHSTMTLKSFYIDAPAIEQNKQPWQFGPSITIKDKVHLILESQLLEVNEEKESSKIKQSITFKEFSSEFKADGEGKKVELKDMPDLQEKIVVVRTFYKDGKIESDIIEGQKTEIVTKLIEFTDAIESPILKSNWTPPAEISVGERWELPEEVIKTILTRVNVPSFKPGGKETADFIPENVEGKIVGSFEKVEQVFDREIGYFKVHGECTIAGKSIVKDEQENIKSEKPAILNIKLNETFYKVDLLSSQLLEQQTDGVETFEIITENKDEHGKLKDKIINKITRESKTTIIVK